MPFTANSEPIGLHQYAGAGICKDKFFLIELDISCHSHEKFSDLSPTPFLTHWAGKDSFLCISGHFMQFLAKTVK